jgi:hypothetical protein
MTGPDALRQQIRSRLAQQRALVAVLLEARDQVQGSLFERYGLCGKETCACRTGRRHGPYYVLSTRSGGRGGFAYLEASQVAEARGLLRRHREYRRGLRRLQKLNRDLVELLRRYQRAAARQGGRRLGLASWLGQKSER